MTEPLINVVALISGRGTNLQAIIDQTKNGDLPIKLCTVISDNEKALGLDRAKNAGISTHVILAKNFSSTAEFERKLIEHIDSEQTDLVVLAGFMRILSSTFVNHYAGRLINIHPSLLPAYPGLNTHARALADNVSEHGASVHFVTELVDAGPVILQAAVPVIANDTPESLAARVLQQEHRIYPEAIRWFAQGRLTLENGRVSLDGNTRTKPALATPRQF